MVIDMETLSLPTESRFYGNREKEQVKQRVQRRIVLCSVMLMAGKFAAYFLTNSVGVLTDAMESIVNVTAGLISLYSLYRAARPADRNHPFGYGKIELISASIEGLLIRWPEPAHRLRRHPQAVRTLADRAARHGHRDRSGGGER